jgi:hypothetical protein
MGFYVQGEETIHCVVEKLERGGSTQAEIGSINACIAYVNEMYSKRFVKDNYVNNYLDGNRRDNLELAVVFPRIIIYSDCQRASKLFQENVSFRKIQGHVSRTIMSLMPEDERRRQEQFSHLDKSVRKMLRETVKSTVCVFNQ